MGLTRPNNCEWDAALSQEVLPSKFGIHEAPSYVVQDQSDGVEPVHGMTLNIQQCANQDSACAMTHALGANHDGASDLFLGVTSADDTRTMRLTLLLAAASNVLPTPCKARHMCS